MDREEMNKRLGLTEREMDLKGQEYESDAWDAKSIKKVFVGRPALSSGETKTMTLKIPESTLFEVDHRAYSLGVSRSKYIRDLIYSDLRTTKL